MWKRHESRFRSSRSAVACRNMNKSARARAQRWFVSWKQQTVNFNFEVKSVSCKYSSIYLLFSFSTESSIETILAKTYFEQSEVPEASVTQLLIQCAGTWDLNFDSSAESSNRPMAAQLISCRKLSLRIDTEVNRNNSNIQIQVSLWIFTRF